MSDKWCKRLFLAVLAWLAIAVVLQIVVSLAFR